MPIFEYTCTGCNTQFEDLVLGREDAVSCPHCGPGETRKLMSRCRSKFGGPGHETGMSACQPSSGSGCSGCAGG
ncbi:MAG: zinc ribbon domain-containing protein, partial [Desulfohalobiaceae bacterium]|nr:zinc ribbon domain-containing protein [Desulfohalobiaceae bacterium]